MSDITTGPLANTMKKLQIRAPPPMQFTLRTKEGVEVWTTGRNEKDDLEATRTAKWDIPKCEHIAYSSDGKLIAICSSDHVALVSADTLQEVMKLPLPGVSKVHFSPASRYFVCLGKYLPNHPEGGNLTVWRIRELPQQQHEQHDDGSTNADHADGGESKGGQERVVQRGGGRGAPLLDEPLLVLRYDHKPTFEEFWPIVQWNDMETICAALSNEELQFYDVQMQLRDRLDKRKTAFFSMSSQTAVAVYYKANHETGAKSGVNIYKYPNLGKHAVTYKFDNVDAVDMIWNKRGSTLLVQTTANTNTSNTNYYGENHLYFMRANGSLRTEVMLGKEQNIHMVEWSPKGSEFLVVYGLTPASATLFNDKAQPIFEFGKRAQNRVSWNSHGRFICLAAFGGFGGQMEFWDRSDKIKIGTAAASEASTFQWAPDGRIFLTATVTPTLRVSNKFQLWKYNGQKLQTVDFDCLYQIMWRPVTPSAFPNRPASPRAIQEGKDQVQKTQEANVTSYVPPHLRKQGATSPVTIAREDDRTQQKMIAVRPQEARQRREQMENTKPLSFVEKQLLAQKEMEEKKGKKKKKKNKSKKKNE